MALEVLQGKVLPENLALFKETQELSGCSTYNQFIEVLLEAYRNPKTKPVEVEKPTEKQTAEIVQLNQTIEQLNNEIGRLKTQIDLDKTALQDAEETRLTQLQTIQELQKQPLSVQVNADQELLTIPPIVRLVLQKEAIAAKRKTGKDFTHGDILLNSFWESVEVGRVYPFFPWTQSDLMQLKKQLQSADQ